MHHKQLTDSLETGQRRSSDKTLGSDHYYSPADKVRQGPEVIRVEPPALGTYLPPTLYDRVRRTPDQPTVLPPRMSTILPPRMTDPPEETERSSLTSLASPRLGRVNMTSHDGYSIFFTFKNTQNSWSIFYIQKPHKH
jgi:hypothetical protein